MSLELIIRPEAEADAQQAFRWYNEQVPGLGQEFLAEVDRVLESIRANPEIHGLVYREYRRALTRRFPYGVFYAVRPERIVVFAILHSARDPRLWTERSRNAR
jgi:plasmid stabilization system protein ParE